MAINVFAKLGDVKGESRDERHRDEIDVLSWAWGMTQAVTQSGGTGAGAGKTTVADLTFTHALDKASPLVMKACTTGEHIREATLTARKAGHAQQDYLIITMTDITVTSVTPSWTGDDATPVETVSLRFGKVALEYKAQKPDGSLDGGTQFAFDIKANRIG